MTKAKNENIPELCFETKEDALHAYATYQNSYRPKMSKEELSTITDLLQKYNLPASVSITVKIDTDVPLNWIDNIAQHVESYTLSLPNSSAIRQKIFQKCLHLEAFRDSDTKYSFNAEELFQLLLEKAKSSAPLSDWEKDAINQTKPSALSEFVAHVVESPYSTDKSLVGNYCATHHLFQDEQVSVVTGYTQQVIENDEPYATSTISSGNFAVSTIYGDDLETILFAEALYISMSICPASLENPEPGRHQYIESTLMLESLLEDVDDLHDTYLNGWSIDSYTLETLIDAYENQDRISLSKKYFEIHEEIDDFPKLFEEIGENLTLSEIHEYFTKLSMISSSITSEELCAFIEKVTSANVAEKPSMRL